MQKLCRQQGSTKAAAVELSSSSLSSTTGACRRANKIGGGRSGGSGAGGSGAGGGGAGGGGAGGGGTGVWRTLRILRTRRIRLSSILTRGGMMAIVETCSTSKGVFFFLLLTYTFTGPPCTEVS